MKILFWCSALILVCALNSPSTANDDRFNDPEYRRRVESEFGAYIKHIHSRSVRKAPGGPSVPGEFTSELAIVAHGRARTFKLVAPFGYIAPSGARWAVPTETVVDGLAKETILDGASIPRAFWTVIGSPWAGPYARASVIHDYYCEFRTRPWQDVHRVFYDAMLTSEVDWFTAKVMYFAVYRFGPRWEFDERDVLVCEEGGPSDCKRWGAVRRKVAIDTTPAWFFDWPIVVNETGQAVNWIIDQDPSLEKIEQLAEAQRRKLPSSR